MCQGIMERRCRIVVKGEAGSSYEMPPLIIRFWLRLNPLDWSLVLAPIISVACAHRFQHPFPRLLANS